MSPNLAEGCDPVSLQGIGELTPGAGVAQAILLEWTEAEDDEGTLEKRCTQIAQEWPLEDNSKFENTQAASPYAEGGLQLFASRNAPLGKGNWRRGVWRQGQELTIPLQKYSVPHLLSTLGPCLAHLHGFLDGDQTCIRRIARNWASLALHGLYEEMPLHRVRALASVLSHVRDLGMLRTQTSSHYPLYPVFEIFGTHGTT